MEFVKQKTDSIAEKLVQRFARERIYKTRVTL